MRICYNTKVFCPCCSEKRNVTLLYNQIAVYNNKPFAMVRCPNCFNFIGTNAIEIDVLDGDYLSSEHPEDAKRYEFCGKFIEYAEKLYKENKDITAEELKIKLFDFVSTLFDKDIIEKEKETILYNIQMFIFDVMEYYGEPEEFTFVYFNENENVVRLENNLFQRTLPDDVFKIF